MTYLDTKLKVFISQPMSGLSDSEVAKVRKQAEEVIDKYFMRFNNRMYEIVSTYTDQEAKDAEIRRHPKIYRLGHALMKLADCDYVYFAGDWKNKRSCVIEFIVARMFEMNIIPNEDNDKNKVSIQIINSKVKEYDY